MVRVLSLVSYRFLPPRFGGQRAIALLNQYLSAQVPLSCVTTKENDPSAAKGYQVQNILGDGKLRYVNPFYFFTLRRLIREQQITHLMLEHPYFGWLGVWLQRATGVQLIIRSHNIEGLRWKSLGKWWWKILWNYEKWVHRNARYNFFIQEDDLEYAVKEFGLDRNKCLLVTYGIEAQQAPAVAARKAAKEWLQQQHAIPADHSILLFNGAFDYAPNLLALQSIIDHINPLLVKSSIPYTILICGRNIPESISKQEIPNMLIAGFVDNIDPYFKGSDIFLNPVTEGGGIKTKLVEALGGGMNAVSSLKGALGVDPELCNGKLIVTNDEDWAAMVRAVLSLIGNETQIPEDFYRNFYWGNIANRAATYIQI